MKNSMDMLHVSMVDKILLFAFPLALGSILQQLFNSIDVMVIGKFCSSQALAAVGANTPVVALLVNLFVGISIGSNVIIAKYIGQEEYGRIKKAVSTSIILGLICEIGLMILGISISKWLLTIMSCPEDVLGYAIQYLKIYCVGMRFI